METSNCSEECIYTVSLKNIQHEEDTLNTAIEFQHSESIDMNNNINLNTTMNNNMNNNININMNNNEHYISNNIETNSPQNIDFHYPADDHIQYFTTPVYNTPNYKELDHFETPDDYQDSKWNTWLNYKHITIVRHMIQYLKIIFINLGPETISLTLHILLGITLMLTAKGCIFTPWGEDLNAKLFIRLCIGMTMGFGYWLLRFIYDYLVYRKTNANEDTTTHYNIKIFSFIVTLLYFEIYTVSILCICNSLNAALIFIVIPIATVIRSIVKKHILHKCEKMKFNGIQYAPQMIYMMTHENVYGVPDLYDQNKITDDKDIYQQNSNTESFDMLDRIMEPIYIHTGILLNPMKIILTACWKTIDGVFFFLLCGIVSGILCNFTSALILCLNIFPITFLLSTFGWICSEINTKTLIVYTAIYSNTMLNTHLLPSTPLEP